MDIALDLPVHLYFTTRQHIAGHGEVFSDDRRRHAVWPPERRRSRLTALRSWAALLRHGLAANGFACRLGYWLLLIKIAHIRLWLLTDTSTSPDRRGARGNPF